MDPDTPPPASSVSPLRWTLGFLLVGLAWGFTTPFIRRAAIAHDPPSHAAVLDDPARSWAARKILGVWFKVTDLLRNPRYAIPLLINLSGSVWFFLLIGKAGEFCSSSDCYIPTRIRGRGNVRRGGTEG